MSIGTIPAQGGQKAARSGGVASLFGRLLALGLVGAAGFGGWVGVEHFDLSIPTSGTNSYAVATELPTLGDGLPVARLASPAPWRQFSLTYQSDVQTNRFWVDLDEWRLRIESSGTDGDSAVEIQGDQSYTRAANSGDWVEQDAQSTRSATAWLMADIGPFVLTDLVPPQTLGFTTLELEGTSRDERVYEVSVDAATLQAQHPLAYQRWAAATRLIDNTSGVYRIRVRADGYVVRIDGETASVQWDDIVGVDFFSPLGASEEAPVVAGQPAPGVPPAEPGAADVPASD